MRGFKGFDPDLKCRDFPYEVGQSYSHDGPVGLCQQGFHFCERLRDCFEFYDPDNGNRFCEVEAWEDIQSDGKKSVAQNIEIIRELTPIEICRVKYGYGNGDGDGDGDGNGDGYGDGYGDGNGYGNGNGNGDGYGTRINEILLYMEEENT